MAGGMAKGFMQNLLMSEAMNYGLEQLSQYVDSDTMTKALILMSMLCGKSKKNQNQGITSNNKGSGDSVNSKSSGGKKDTKDGDSSRNGPDKLNKNGLTTEQEKHFRNKIDAAEARGDKNAAVDARYERHIQKQKNLGKKPLPRDKWDAAYKNLKNSSQRGAAEEVKGRKALEDQLGRKIENNNEALVIEYKSSEGVDTRPDSIGRNKEGAIDLVHDHKHKTG
ncbi:hypothetical protein ASD24_05515 [Paenibacillus sp. Root52]|uniref:hypothetical protein n=1 Tax=Paenibacillus sp. Root52 TaxID=1736552 RepID=UPI0007016700|nr:hypothetical protein [Paenibacillus sp. Root52]KQY87320.1 hypothetical protein ASD24_05515 [Paenibacillus sp. Root52]